MRCGRSAEAACRGLGVQMPWLGVKGTASRGRQPREKARREAPGPRTPQLPGQPTSVRPVPASSVVSRSRLPVDTLMRRIRILSSCARAAAKRGSGEKCAGCDTSEGQHRTGPAAPHRTLTVCNQPMQYNTIIGGLLRGMHARVAPVCPERTPGPLPAGTQPACPSPAAQQQPLPPPCLP